MYRRSLSRFPVQFVSALPMHLRLQRSNAELKSWFSLMDEDGNGHVSMNEFFAWSLSASAVITGTGIIQGFQRYLSIGTHLTHACVVQLRKDLNSQNAISSLEQLRPQPLGEARAT